MATGPAWLSSSGSSAGPPLSYFAPRPQVSYYAPRPAPSQRYTPPQQRSTPAFRPPSAAPSPGFSALSSFAQSDAGQEQIAKVQEQQQAPSGFDKASGFGGLGFLINNPVTRAVVEPLKYLDMGRKAAVLGVEEVAEGLADAPGWVQALADAVPGGAARRLIDTERTEEDKRSNWEKLNPNSDYGFGQLLDEDNPVWLNRTLGFAGDVGLDPLTYVTGGASRLVSAGSHADEAARGLTKAQTALKAAEEAGKARDITKAAKTLTAAEDYVARAPSMGERFFEQALPHNKTGRANFFGELAKTPEGQQFLQQFPEQVQRGGQRGLQAMSQEAKDFLRISDPALKIRGLDMRIPGTKTLARGLVAGGGAARVGADQVPYVDTIRNIRVPKGLRPSWDVLTRGKGGDVFTEATTVGLYNMMREGTGAQLSRGNRIITNGVRKFFKGVDDDALRTMTRETETAGTRTGINKMLGSILDTYQKVAGRIIDPEYLKDPDTYFPHLLDPNFRRALGRMAKDGNKSALDFVKHLGFVEDDLLEEPTKFFADNLMEGSGFISKARKFGTDPKTGEAQTFNIGGRDITFSENNVDHLNEQLKAAFPEYKGDFYDTNPIRVMEAYNKSLSRQAGRDFASKEMQETGNKLLGRMTGDIDATRLAMNEALSQQGAAPLLSTAQGKYVPGELLEIPPTPIVPGSYQERAPIEKLRTGAEEATSPATKRVLTEEADRLQAEVTASRIGGVEPSDYFVTTKGGTATDEHYAAARRGKTYATAIAAETRVAEDKLRSRIADVRETIITPLKTTVKETRAEIAVVNKKLKTWAKTIDDMGDLNPENFEEFSDLITRVQSEVLNGEMKMKHTARAWKGSGTKAQRKAEAEMKESLNRLRRVRDDAWEKVKGAPEAMRTELADRERILNKPVRDAHDALMWKEMEVPIPHSQAEQDRAITNAMEGYDAGTDPEVLLKNYREVAQGVRREANVVAPGIVPDTPEIAAARQAYHDAVAEVHALGAKYTKRGRIPKAAKEQYDSAVAAKAELDRLTGEATNISEYDAAILQMDALARDIEVAARGGDLGTVQFPEGYTTLEEVKQGLLDGRLTPGDLGKGLGPGDVPRLTAERNRIARKFHQGGRFYKQKQARGILADWETYEKKVLDKTTTERAALEKAIESRARRQESIIWAQAEQEGWHPANRLRYVTGVGENPSNLEGMGWGVGQQRIPEPITEPPQEAAWYTKTRAPSGETGMRGVPSPRTEQEALTSLRSQVEIGSGAQLQARSQAKRATAHLAEEEATAPARLAATQAELAAINAEDMDRALGPLAERTQTYTNLLTDLSDKRSMVIKRDEAAKLRDRLKANPNPKGRWRPELHQVLDDLDAVAKANPYLEDPKLNQVESLLQTHRAELERIDAARIRMIDLDRVAEDAADGTLGDISIVALNNNWHALHNGPINTGDLIMDMELYKRFNNLFELSRQPKIFGRTFNAFTNLFKTYATLSPGFHIRNTIGGIFMNTSDGVALKYQLEGAQLWGKYVRGGEKWLRKQEPHIQDAFQATFGSGAGGRFEEAGVLARTENRLYNRVSSNRATRLSQRAGTRVEGGLRLGMALDSISNGASVQDALSRITRIHFDYAQVSQIDETMKRIIPFWTFMSRNLPLQIEQMWTKPRVYAYYNSLIRNFSLPDEEFTPDYWTRQGAWNTPVEVGGNPLYLQPDLGFTRVQSDLKLAEGVLSGENPGALLAQTNPLIGGTMDFISKRDSFYNRQYDPTDYTKQSGMIGAPLTLIAKALGQTNEAGQVSDNFTNYIQSLVPPLNQGIRLFPGAAGGKRTAQTGAKWARYAGIPIQLLTPEAQDSEYWRQYREILDEQERQQSMLEEAAS